MLIQTGIIVKIKVNTPAMNLMIYCECKKAQEIHMASLNLWSVRINLILFLMPDVKHYPKQETQVSEHSKIQTATPILVKRRGL
jgi:hypothetical protein